MVTNQTHVQECFPILKTFDFDLFMDLQNKLNPKDNMLKWGHLFPQHFQDVRRLTQNM